MQEARYERVHNAWYHSYTILENVNYNVVIENRSVVAWNWGQAGLTAEGIWKLFGVTEIVYDFTMK